MKDVTMKYAAIFDLDGTLIDTPNAIVAMMQRALEAMGAAPADEKVVRSMIGLPLEAGAARVLGLDVDHKDTLRLVDLYRQQFLNWLVPMSRELLFTGVEEGLVQLQRDGALLAIATSKYRKSAELVLRSAGIWHLFSAVAGSDDVTNPKPDKEMAEHVAATLGCHPQDCIMIGDTVHDLHMGRSAGMRTIGVSYGVGNRSDLSSAASVDVADNFSDVVSILQNIET